MKWADLKPWVSKIAPMLGASLGGPLGLGVGTLIGNALGIKDATPQSVQEAIDTGTLTGDQIASLKLAEQDFKIQMAKLEIQSVQDLESLAVADRSSAREREIKTGDVTPRVLAYGVTLGFFGLLIYLMKTEPPVGSKDILNVMLGALGTAWISIVSYYFGSSASSAHKDSLIANK